MSIRQYRPRRKNRRGISAGKSWTLHLVFVLALALQISYPLVEGNLLRTITSLTVYFGAAAMLLHALFSYGFRYFSTFFLITFAFGLLVELLGSKTGWPFGTYKYDGSLGVAISGVPLVVPFAWIMMAHPILIAARKVSSAWVFLYGGIALMCWDLFLDPQMVSAGRWSWKLVGPSIPFAKQIPLSNAAGWLFSGLALMGLLNFALPKERRKFGVNSNVPDIFLAWTLFAGIVGNVFFFHNAALGIYGGLILGAVLTPYFYTVFFGKPDSFN